MKKSFRQLAHAALLAAGFLATPLFVAACPVDAAKPFNSGPLDPAGSQLGLFSEWIVDANGVGLQVCTDSINPLTGVAPPCVVTPVVPGNTLSAQLNRGVEAFYYLANSVFTTTGAYPIDVVIVMGIESAFLAPEPTVGFQTQFQRWRTRINVNQVGIYTVETPWSKSVHRVDTLLPPGNGQNRAEISVPIDVSFGADASVPGLVAPFLVANPPIAGYGPAQGYIGDGLTPTKVTGSPCGANYVKITATGLDGVTPIDINNGSNVVINDQFTVSGKLAPVAAVPLHIGAAYYTRSGGADTVTVMAEGSGVSALQAAMTTDINGSTVALKRDANRFYAHVPVAGALPASLSVTATDSGRPSTPNTQTAAIKDLVTIGLAEARCSGSGANKSCLLTVQASSSDDGSGPNGAPLLTLEHNRAPLVAGAVSTVSPAVPGAVTVLSSQGGVASRPVIVINQ
ncbi:MAG: hypothetical protein RIQ60_978 [Pseudomonadota bacterium]|jgi:hypothetical protein